MPSVRYRAINDYKIIPRGSIIQKDDYGEYKYSIEEDGIITSMSLNIDILNNLEYFESYSPMEISISEENIDDIESKNWKVVFNISCTEKKLMEIKKFIEDGVSNIIDDR